MFYFVKIEASFTAADAKIVGLYGPNDLLEIKPTVDDIYTYQIEVPGRVDEVELNALSPFELKIVRSDPRATCFTVRTDQSGLVGLLRHLHGRGFTILSVTRAR